MRRISSAFPLIAIAAAMLQLSTLPGNAQSFPAGQVTYRAQVRAPFTAYQREQIQSEKALGKPTRATTQQRLKTFVETATDKSKISDSTGRCLYDESNPGTKTSYTYPTWFPTLGTGCISPVILNYFGVEKNAVGANGVRYLYNAQQSTSQVNADLFTATFGLGFQAVLAGTATAGSSQTAPSTTGSAATAAIAHDDSSTTTQTDSVATAVSKIENGGDFNLRFPLPVVSHFGQSYTLDGRFVPNVGFNINKFGAQDTITESTEYTVNLPFELYGQTTSIDQDNPAIAFIDLRPSGEIVSSAMAQSIGLTGSRAFFLGEAAVGVEFGKKVRVSLQYFVGPHQIYQTVSSTGTSISATHIGGFHLAVSFSPQTPNSSTKQ
jgi:hypothetical protein